MFTWSSTFSSRNNCVPTTNMVTPIQAPRIHPYSTKIYLTIGEISYIWQKTQNILRIIFKIAKLKYQPPSGSCHVQYLILIIPSPTNMSKIEATPKRFMLRSERYMTAISGPLNTSHTNTDLIQPTSLSNVRLDVKLLNPRGGNRNHFQSHGACISLLRPHIPTMVPA